MLVGIGVTGNDDLARAAGLNCSDGIVVDRNARSSDPDIYAAGDCTRHHGREGVELRLECVQNAIDQAKHAALALTGKPKDYSEVPWFWSDQYDLKLQIAGLARPSDTLVQRGDPVGRKFSVFHLRDGKVAAVEAVNAGQDYMIGRKLIAEGKPVEASAHRRPFHSGKESRLMKEAPSKPSFIEDNGCQSTPSMFPKAGR